MFRKLAFGTKVSIPNNEINNDALKMLLISDISAKLTLIEEN